MGKYIENLSENKRIFEDAVDKIRGRVMTTQTMDELHHISSELSERIEGNCLKMNDNGFAKKECEEMQEELMLALRDLVNRQSRCIRANLRNGFAFEF